MQGEGWPGASSLPGLGGAPSMPGPRCGLYRWGLESGSVFRCILVGKVTSCLLATSLAPSHIWLGGIQ